MPVTKNPKIYYYMLLQNMKIKNQNKTHTLSRLVVTKQKEYKRKLGELSLFSSAVNLEGVTPLEIK